MLPCLSAGAAHGTASPSCSPFLSLREGLQCIGGYRGFGARLASMPICLCSLSTGQFYLLCWFHATQRSRPSSPRWTTTAIPFLKTLTSPRASSRRAIFQVGTWRCRPAWGCGSHCSGQGPLGPPRHPLSAHSLDPDSEPHPCWERTRGLGSLLTNDAFLGTEEQRRDPSAQPQCSHLFWKRK